LKTETRKRLGQLQKLCQKSLPSGEEFSLQGYTKGNFQTKICEFQSSPDWIPIRIAIDSQEFTQEELKLTHFDNRDNWFP
jgi:hypothetical protein